MIEIVSTLIFAMAIGYAFFLKKNEERRQEWRRASRALWSGAK